MKVFSVVLLLPTYLTDYKPKCEVYRVCAEDMGEAASQAQNIARNSWVMMGLAPDSTDQSEFVALYCAEGVIPNNLI